MLKFLIVLSALFGCNFTNATTNTIPDDLKKAYEYCYQRKDTEACYVLGARFGALGNYAETFKAASKACDIDIKRCDDLDNFVYGNDKSIETKITARLKKACEIDVDICNSYAYALEKEKKFKEAISFAKKYLDEHKSGIYPWFAYLYGDRKTAHEAALESCKKSNDGCAFYLRYMPDHPNRDQIVKHTELNCRSTEPIGIGATSCAILGTYYVMKKYFLKAFDVLYHDCKNNDISCEIIFGISDLSLDQKASAAIQYCKHIKNSPYANDPIWNICSKTKEERLFPKEFADKGKKRLTSFLSEQK